MGLFDKFKRVQSKNQEFKSNSNNVISSVPKSTGKSFYDGETFVLSDKDEVIYDLSIDELNKIYSSAFFQYSDKPEEWKEFKRVLFNKYPHYQDYLNKVSQEMDETDASYEYNSLTQQYTFKAKESMEKGNIDDAIANYEVVITKYKYGFPFPYLDLIKMYMDKCDFENIMRVCDLAIINLGKDGYYYKNEDKIVYKPIEIENYNVNKDYYKNIKFVMNNMVKYGDKIISSLSNIEPLKEDNQFYIKAIVDNNDYKKTKFIESEHSIEFVIEFYNQYLKYNNIKKPYERLAIIYRKLKRFDDEVEICKKGINNLSNPNDIKYFKDRLPKAQDKLKKSIK